MLTYLQQLSLKIKTLPITVDYSCPMEDQDFSGFDIKVPGPVVDSWEKCGKSSLLPNPVFS